MQYDYDLKKARDYHAEMSFARKKAYSEGIEKGMAKGIAEGRAEEKIEIARNMLKMGIPGESIAKVTDLDIEFIKSLKRVLFVVLFSASATGNLTNEEAITYSQSYYRELENRSAIKFDQGSRIFPRLSKKLRKENNTCPGKENLAPNSDKPVQNTLI